VSVSKLRALVIQFLLSTLILASAGYRATTTAIERPAAPPSKPTAAIAENLEASGPNPPGMSPNSVKHEARQVV